MTRTETVSTTFTADDSMTVPEAEESVSDTIKETIENARRRELTFTDSTGNIGLETTCDEDTGNLFDCLTLLTVQGTDSQLETELTTAVTKVVEEPIEEFTATLQEAIRIVTANSDILIVEVDVRIASEAPSMAPSLVGGKCANDPTFKTTKKGRNCNWVAGRPDSRCKMVGEDGSKAKDSCRMSCDLRCACKNSEKKFNFKKKTSKKDSKKGNKKTNCSKIKVADCSKPAGNNKIVADFCPKKCNDCYDL